MESSISNIIKNTELYEQLLKKNYLMIHKEFKGKK